MKKNWEEVLSLLMDGKYQTAKQLSMKINVSEKTVRKRIKDAKYYMAESGAEIISKPNKGYMVNIYDENSFKLFIDSFNKSENKNFNSKPSLRYLYMTYLLVLSSEYMTIDELANRLCVSRNTIINDFNKINNIFFSNKLEIERKPLLGIKVIGDEFNKRECLCKILIKKTCILNKKQSNDLMVIREGLGKVFKNNNLDITFSLLDNLSMHVYMPILRACRDMSKLTIRLDTDSVDINKDSLIIDICSMMIKNLNFKLSEEEKSYIYVVLLAKLPSGDFRNQSKIKFESKKANAIAKEMIYIIEGFYSVDLGRCDGLLDALIQHIEPLIIRIRYGIELTNPLLNEIKKEHSLSYFISMTACTAINKHYSCSLSNDEIAYFAIIIQFYVVPLIKQSSRKNVVIVCSSGRGTTQLFIQRYKRYFEPYINVIYELSLNELDNFDLKINNVDYIFTTIKLDKSYSIPVFEMSSFFNEKEVNLYKKCLEVDNVINEFYKKDLFMGVVKHDSKERIIRTMCEYAKDYIDDIDSFYEAIIKRERLGQTDFLNRVAIPHPYKVMGNRNFVVVAILDEEIFWENNYIKVIFLTSIVSELNSTMENFYKYTTSLMFDKEKIDNLICNPKFDNLVKLMTS